MNNINIIDKINMKDISLNSKYSFIEELSSMPINIIESMSLGIYNLLNYNLKEVESILLNDSKLLGLDLFKDTEFKTNISGKDKIILREHIFTYNDILVFYKALYYNMKIHMTKRINNDLKNEELDSILYDGNNKIILESLKDYNEWYAYKRINSVTKDVLFKQSKNISEYLKEKALLLKLEKNNNKVLVKR